MAAMGRVRSSGELVSRSGPQTNWFAAAHTNCGNSVDVNTGKMPMIGTVRSRKFVASLPKLEPIEVNQVLLIDDNPIQLRVRETILRGAGFQVSIATTAEGALAVLRTAAIK